MKKLRDKVEQNILKVESQWKTLSVEKQRLMTKIFFGSYVFLTVIVLINVMISMEQRSNTMSINHIDGISKKSVEKGSIQKDTIESPSKK